ERPEQASWLSAGERTAIVARLEEESRARAASPRTVTAALTNGRIWLLAIVYFTLPVALYAMSFWLPQILKTASGGSDLQVGLLSAIPYAVGAVAMVLHGRHSDRTGERRGHVAIACLVGGIAF